MTAPIVLAVDGGNSKTDLALVAADGRVLSLVRGPLSSPHHLGVDGSVEVLERLFREAVEEAGVANANGAPVAAVARLCMAGVDFPAEEEVLQERIARLGWAEATSVANDTFAVLRAGTESGWGVAVVCGAGINCVGVAPDGRQVRFPALGEISGDWGGGYDVGLAAVSAAARSEDGRGPETTLERAVPAHFGLATPQELAEAIHTGKIERRRVLELPPIVFAEAERDEVAAGIVERVAAEIVDLARAALTRLELQDDRVEVALARRPDPEHGRPRARPDPRGAAGRSRRRSSCGRRRRRRWSARRCSGSTRSGRTLRRTTACGSSSPPRRRTGVRTMADVRFVQATRIYPGTDAPAVDALDLHIAGRRVRRARRPLRLGEDDRAAHARRPRGGRRGRDLDRRARRHRRGAEAPRRRDGVPELRALSLPHRRGEHRLPAADREGEEVGARAPRRARSPSCSA